jgi:hypothetical protein
MDVSRGDSDQGMVDYPLYPDAVTLNFEAALAAKQYHGVRVCASIF